jgi:hypothetical protein
MCITFSLLYAGVYVEREKATPAVGIKFTFEKKVFKNSTS